MADRKKELEDEMIRRFNLSKQTGEVGTMTDQDVAAAPQAPWYDRLRDTINAKLFPRPEQEPPSGPLSTSGSETYLPEGQNSMAQESEQAKKLREYFQGLFKSR